MTGSRSGGFTRALMAIGCAMLVGCGAPTQPSGGGQGSSKTPTTAAELLIYQGADRQQILEAGAKTEGKVVWYTSLAGGLLKAVTEGYEKKYPGVKVEIYRAESPEIATRLQEEAQAKKPNADVLEIPSASLNIVREAKLVTPYFTPEAKRYPADVREMGQGELAFWVADRESYIGFAYNTNLISAADAPKTFSDLLKPALKGKMVLSGTISGTTAIGNMLTHQGEDFAKQLAQQEMRVQVVSAAAMADLIATGEVPASPSVSHASFKTAKSKGAPVEWATLEPTTANAGSVAMPLYPVRPHAALLLADYLLSEEGQAAFTANQYQSPAGTPIFKRWFPDSGLSPADYDKKQRQWDEYISASFAKKQ